MKVRKLKAGALQLTLFIIVVIAVLLSTFIILVHTQNQFSQQSGFVIETVRQANMGIDFASTNALKLKDTILIDSDDRIGTLKVHRDFWGVFEKVTSQSQIKKKDFTKVALIGAKQNEFQQTALYLQDHNKPLVVVGNTVIQGLSFLPKLGVKPGTISGQSYYGEQLIYGQTQLANELPRLQSDLIEELKSLQNSDLMSAEPWHEGLHLKNSFLNPLQTLYSVNAIHFANAELSGHILVRSQSKIIVEGSTKLNDVILIAPEVEVKSNVSGNFQVIASKNITVGSGCNLNYPSALALIEKESMVTDSIPNDEDFKIHIEDNSVVNGLILYSAQPKEDNFKPQVTINKKATIIGEIYCDQNLELRGTVKGSVFASNVVTQANGSIYQNHLLDARISSADLKSEYVGFLFENSKKEVVKWLY